MVASVLVLIVGGINIPARGQDQAERSAVDAKPPKDTLIATVTVGSQPFSLVTNTIVGGPILLNSSSEESGFYGGAITPNGKYLYISDSAAGVVYVVDITPQ